MNICIAGLNRRAGYATASEAKGAEISSQKFKSIGDLKIVVYGKWLTSETLFAIKTKSLTVKCITYRIYSKYRKLRIETPCLTTETWRLILNDFLLT